MIVNFMCHGVSRLNIITGCVCKGVASWVSIWIGGLCEVAHPPQCGRVSSNPFRARREQSLLFSCLTAELGHLIFSCPWTQIYTIDSRGSQGFGLKLYHRFSQVSCLQTEVCRTLSLHTHRSQSFIINYRYDIYKYLYWVVLSPGEP